MTPRTHAEHATATKVATPCTAHHVNYGGGCLNCGWTPRTLNTRPTDAELAELLDGAHDALFAKWQDDHYSDGTTTEEDNDLLAFVGKLREASLALEAASAEPSPLAHITTIGQLFEVIDYDFDGSGLTVTDGNLLANTIANTFPALINDMPHLVTTDDEAASLHRPDCSPDCSTHHRMTNEAPYNDESYTVSGVDYTFTEGC